MRLLVPFWKGLRIVEHLLTGAILAVAVTAGQGLGYRVGWLDAVVCWWYRRLLRCLGLCVWADGAVAGATLLVANHVSWLDIPVIGSQGNVRFLSKVEVRTWPLIGWMSELAGTVFITRGAHQVREVVEGIHARIQAGQSVVIFPEGTTTDGREVQRFHPRLFAVCQQAGLAGLAVQPVTLHYGSGPEPDPVAPFSATTTC
jgi:1-acyl-sn-glycerol-3-phosphate acyltransferase